MNLAYRFSHDEFIALAEAFSLRILPPWLKAVRKDWRLEQILESLEKKDFVISAEDTYLPAPLIGFLFDEMTSADVLLVVEEYAVCYVCQNITILLENMQREHTLRLYPFEAEEDGLAYLKDCEYAKAKRELFLIRETPEAEATAKRLKQLLEAMN